MEAGSTDFRLWFVAIIGASSLLISLYNRQEDKRDKTRANDYEEFSAPFRSCLDELLEINEKVVDLLESLQESENGRLAEEIVGFRDMYAGQTKKFKNYVHNHISNPLVLGTDWITPIQTIEDRAAETRDIAGNPKKPLVERTDSVRKLTETVREQTGIIRAYLRDVREGSTDERGWKRFAKEKWCWLIFAAVLFVGAMLLLPTASRPAQAESKVISDGAPPMLGG